MIQLQERSGVATLGGNPITLRGLEIQFRDQAPDFTVNKDLMTEVKGFRATKLASTGGFQRAGNTTFMIGTEDDRERDVMQVIRSNCKPEKSHP